MSAQQGTKGRDSLDKWEKLAMRRYMASAAAREEKKPKDVEITGSSKVGSRKNDGEYAFDGKYFFARDNIKEIMTYPDDFDYGWLISDGRRLLEEAQNVSGSSDRRFLWDLYNSRLAKIDSSIVEDEKSAKRWNDLCFDPWWGAFCGNQIRVEEAVCRIVLKDSFCRSQISSMVKELDKHVFLGYANTIHPQWMYQVLIERFCQLRHSSEVIKRKLRIQCLNLPKNSPSPVHRLEVPGSSLFARYRDQVDEIPTTREDCILYVMNDLCHEVWARAEEWYCPELKLSNEDSTCSIRRAPIGGIGSWLAKVFERLADLFLDTANLPKWMPFPAPANLLLTCVHYGMFPSLNHIEPRKPLILHTLASPSPLQQNLDAKSIKELQEFRKTLRQNIHPFALAAAEALFEYGRVKLAGETKRLERLTNDPKKMAKVNEQVICRIQAALEASPDFEKVSEVAIKDRPSSGETSQRSSPEVTTGTSGAVNETQRQEVGDGSESKTEGGKTRKEKENKEGGSKGDGDRPTIIALPDKVDPASRASGAEQKEEQMKTVVKAGSQKKGEHKVESAVKDNATKMDGSNGVTEWTESISMNTSAAAAAAAYSLEEMRSMYFKADGLISRERVDEGRKALEKRTKPCAEEGRRFLWDMYNGRLAKVDPSIVEDAVSAKRWEEMCFIDWWGTTKAHTRILFEEAACRMILRDAFCRSQISLIVKEVDRYVFLGYENTMIRQAMIQINIERIYALMVGSSSNRKKLHKPCLGLPTPTTNLATAKVVRRFDIPDSTQFAWYRDEEVPENREKGILYFLRSLCEEVISRSEWLYCPTLKTAGDGGDDETKPSVYYTNLGSWLSRIFGRLAQEFLDDAKYLKWMPKIIPFHFVMHCQLLSIIEEFSGQNEKKPLILHTLASSSPLREDLDQDSLEEFKAFRTKLRENIHPFALFVAEAIYKVFQAGTLYNKSEVEQRCVDAGLLTHETTDDLGNASSETDVKEHFSDLEDIESDAMPVEKSLDGVSVSEEQRCESDVATMPSLEPLEAMEWIDEICTPSKLLMTMRKFDMPAIGEVVVTRSFSLRTKGTLNHVLDQVHSGEAFNPNCYLEVFEGDSIAIILNQCNTSNWTLCAKLDNHTQTPTLGWVPRACLLGSNDDERILRILLQCKFLRDALQGAPVTNDRDSVAKLFAK